MKKLILLLCIILLVACSDSLEIEKEGSDLQGVKTIEIKKYRKENDQMLLSFDGIESYNKDGFMINYIEYNLVDEGHIYKEVKYEYDDYNRRLSTQTYINGQLTHESVNEYDGENLISIISYKDGEMTMKTSHEYKDKYKKTTMEMIEFDQKTIDEIYYNDDGSYEGTSISDGDYNFVMTYSINSKDQLTKMTREQDGQVDETTEIFYENNGLTERAVIKDASGHERTQVVTYDDYRNVLTISYDSELNTEYIYAYNNKGHYTYMETFYFDTLTEYEERVINYWE